MAEQKGKGISVQPAHGISNLSTRREFSVLGRERTMVEESYSLGSRTSIDRRTFLDRVVKTAAALGLASLPRWLSEPAHAEEMASNKTAPELAISIEQLRRAGINEQIVNGNGRGGVGIRYQDHMFIASPPLNIEAPPYNYINTIIDGKLGRITFEDLKDSRNVRIAGYFNPRTNEYILGVIEVNGNTLIQYNVTTGKGFVCDVNATLRNLRVNATQITNPSIGLVGNMLVIGGLLPKVIVIFKEEVVILPPSDTIFQGIPQNERTLSVAAFEDKDGTYIIITGKGAKGFDLVKIDRKSKQVVESWPTDFSDKISGGRATVVPEIYIGRDPQTYDPLYFVFDVGDEKLLVYNALNAKYLGAVLKKTLAFRE